MKIKVITSYKPGTWEQYAEKSVRSVLENWPEGIAVNVYYEGQEPDNHWHPRKKYIDLHNVQPNLVTFKERHKNDPRSQRRITGNTRRGETITRSRWYGSRQGIFPLGRCKIC